MSVFFENSELIKNAICINSQLSVSDKHKKDGKNTLEWSFAKQGELVLNIPVGYSDEQVEGDNRTYAFCACIYSEDEIEKNIYIEFGKNKKVCCGFKVNINYDGFRPICVKFDTDMDGKPENNMNFMRIRAVSGGGKLWFGRMITACKIDPRGTISNFQTEKLFLPDKSALNDSMLRTFLNIPKPTNKVDTKKLADKYRLFIKEDLKDIAKMADMGKVEEYLCDSVDDMFIWTIKRDIENYDDSSCVKLGDYNRVMFSLAYRYAFENDAESGQLCVRMIEHLLDEGFACGSGFGIYHVMDYGMRYYYPAVFLVKNLLKEKDLLKNCTEYMKWVSFFGDIFSGESRRVSFDTFNNLLQGYLCICLIEKSYISDLKNMIENAVTVSNTLCGMFKADGSAYHHMMHYTIYALDGLNGFMPLMYILEETPYAVSDRVFDIIKKVIENIIFYSTEDGYYPASMSGRHPTGKWQLRPIVIKYYEKICLIKGLNPYKRCDGQLTMNMACASFHRKNGVLVSVKGFSKYLWGSEIYEKCNICGRHLGYGFLEIYKENPEKSGYCTDGLDWAHLPGTTALYFDALEMESKIYNLDVYSGVEEVLISESAFAGGCDNRENGIFSFELSGHPKYDGSLRAKKTYIMHGDNVLCIGSGICSQDEKREVHTTMFQQKGDIDGYGMDVCGNAYYTNEQVVFCNKNQHSLDLYGGGIRENVFSTAYINHGICPENATYMYQIGLAGADKKDFEILQNDSVAHVVSVDDTVYYSIFDAKTFSNGDIKVSHPCILIIKNETVYAVIPDLGLYDEDITQYDSCGNRKEVSIYSRTWLKNEVKKYDFSLSIKGREYSRVLRGGEITKIKVEGHV